MKNEKIEVPVFDVDKVMDNLIENEERQTSDEILEVIKATWSLMNSLHESCLRMQRDTIEELKLQLTEKNTNGS